MKINLVTPAMILACATVAYGIAPVTGFAGSSESTMTQLAQATLKVKPGAKVRLPNGNVVVNLTSSDCKNVGGKVIEVADSRCGASHQYCRMPDTNAVCIDKRN